LNYEWKPGVGIFTKYDAQQVGEELERIPVLKPQYVVEYAEQHKDTELYRCFEWNDAKAAKSWRKQQAGDILRMIVIVESIRENNKIRQIKIRAFENANDDADGSIYIPIKKALNDPAYRDCILESIRRGIEELSEKGKNYAAIINNANNYQKGLDYAMKALGTNQRRGKKSA
jgi:hypothetical protein